MAARRLYCDSCTAKALETSRSPDVVEAGEAVRVVTGTSLGGYVCDLCNADLGPGVHCAAVTMLARGEIMGPWEYEYVELDWGDRNG